MSSATIIWKAERRLEVFFFIEKSPFNEFVYASPAYGYAQVAIAFSAMKAGKKATIFTAKRKKPHPLTIKAAKYGAKIIMVSNGYLNVVQKKAKDYALAHESFLFPFGADIPEISHQVVKSAKTLDIKPSEVWTVSGSGTLTRALQKVWQDAVFHAVLIGKRNIDTGSAVRYYAPEKFEEAAKYPPPFNSCINYDAKAWRFFMQHAKRNSLFWNVA